MRAFVFLFFFQIGYSFAQTTNNPTSYSNADAWEIESIDVGIYSTTIQMKLYTNNTNYNFFVDRSMYIQEYGKPNSHRYMIKEFVNNELGVSYNADTYYTYNFTWKFETLNNNIKNINIIEPLKNGWFWKNVNINNGNYKLGNYNYKGYEFNIHSFQMGSDIKVKYIAKNAYNQFYELKKYNKIILACSGAFSESWEANSKPVGMTVDNGTIVNRHIDTKMDGLVIVDNNSVGVIDLDNLSSGQSLVDGSILSLNPRENYSDKQEILNAAKINNLTIFQTQLIYSFDKSSNFNNLYFGKIAERRLLAVCTKESNLFNVIVDIPDGIYLNLSAKYSKKVLEDAGYKVWYILNLDTGGKNIFVVNENNELYYSKNADNKLEEATNLIIFYN